MKKVLYKLLTSFFLFLSIYVQAAVTLISQNSGESLLGCTVQEIKWSGNSFYVDIYYSIDNGVVWKPIVKRRDNYPYSHAWTLPQINASKCLIKIADSYNPNTDFDISDMPFSITSTSNSTLKVTSPNGGEKWGTVSEKIITWNKTGSVSKVRISYSDDNGGRWLNIDTMANNTGSYRWILPDYNLNANYLVKVSEYGNDCLSDESDATFSLIDEPNTVITSPNGGERIFTSSIKKITWTRSFNNSSYVSLDYSTDAGVTWKKISAAEANHGFFDWVVPNTVSDKCLIKISSYPTPTITDVSNAVFSIVNPSISIVEPIAGASLSGCSKTSIRWTSSGTSPYVNIYYSADNGLTWNQIANSVLNFSGNNTFEWNCPDVASNKYLLKVVDVYTATTVGNSGSFEVVKSGEAQLKVLSPNGGDSLKTGARVNLTWTSDGASDKVNISYSGDAGMTWSSPITVPNTGKYLWTVPTTASSKALVKITDVQNDCVVDLSDAAFNIVAAPFILVTFPNASSDTLYTYNNRTITWTSGNVPGEVKIHYSPDLGATWKLITSYASNSGSYYWSVPDTISHKCLIKVSSYASNTDLFDVSDAPFTITNPVYTVTLPNGGETVNGCTSTNINWKSKGGTSAVFVYYSSDLGTTWNQVGTSYFSNKEGSNSCPWTPPGLLSGNCLIKVVDYYNADALDVSDKAFTIAKTDTAYIKVTYPNNGETFGTSRNETITWKTSGKISSLTLKYSTDGGNNWTIISSAAANTGTYNWTVPNTLSSKYLISITDNNNTCTTDMSDKPFSVIAVPSLQVQSFNYAQNTLLNGNSVYFYWSATNMDTSRVKIQYSIDSAKTWKLIVADLKNLGSYNWKIPAENSTKCFVKVSMVSNPDIFDINDVAFAIAVPKIKITFPKGGETLAGCTYQKITWSGPSTSGGVKIQYSVDSGKEWITLASYASSSAKENFFNWNVPSVAASTYRIRIEDTGAPTIKDSSASDFAVSYSGNTITITSPTDKDVLNVGTGKKITWTNTGSIPTVSLKYTLDDGGFWYINTGVPNTGSFLWTLPTTPSSNYRLFVSEYGNECVSDFSRKKLTIKNAPYINVTWEQNFNAIVWSSNTLDTSHVNIEFSSDSMTTWTTLASNVRNFRSYNILPPNVNSSKCFFRVSQYGNPSFYGINLTPITFTRHFAITSPIAGEVVTGCATKNITWTSSTYCRVNLQLSADNGATWQPITNYSIVSYTGTNTYSWVPVGINSSKCLIRVIYDGANQIYETSVAPFSIQYSGPTLRLDSPNGGQTLGTFSQQEIRWTTNGAIPKVLLNYSSDGGAIWNSITFPAVNNSGKFNWVVPNALSSNYLIKISDNSGCITDVSDAKFSVVGAKNIAVFSPKVGDQLYSNNTVWVEWRASQLSSEFVALDYSLDSGKTWIAISAKEGNNGFYVWKVPSVSATKVQVRVKDFGDPSFYDVSDSVFSIVKQSITITTPNNGETLTGCTAQKITWTNVGPYYYDLFYSIDGGTSWNTIAKSVYSNFYDWTLPSANASNCLIKVASGADNEIFDLTDLPFKIYNPTLSSLKIESPNGGEIYKASTDKTIIWSTTGTVNNVALKYSTDGGTVWTAIANISNTNSYKWLLPTATSDKYLVSITDASNACVSDRSDAVFTVQSIPTLAVTYPKSKDTLYSYTSYSVSVSKSYDVPNYVLELSTDSLRTWKRISPPYFDPYATWKAPDLVSNNCFIRASYGNSYGISARFSIIRPTINITAPVGGETILGCSYKEIKWFSKGTNGNVDLFYSADNGTTWKLIASNISNYNGNNYYYWAVPHIISKNCLIKIVNASSGISVATAAPFIVNNGLKSLEVVSPIGGESFATGMQKTILWESLGGIARVDLRYSIDAGNSWNNIAYNIANTGSYNWTLPATASSKVLVRISDNTNACVFDESNFTFNIDPALTLIAPNGGDKLQGCSNTTIAWKNIGSSPYVYLSYSVDAGITWSNIASAVPNVAGNNTYTWNVVGINTSKCLFKVSDYYNKEVNDVSNAVCTIQSSASATLTLTSPNGGESWGTGKQKLITWTGQNVSNKVNIDYSPDGGATWGNLAYGLANTGSYDWRLPGQVTSKYIVRITDYANSCIVDHSDGTFNVIPSPFITISSLNTYEKIYAGKHKKLYWESGSLKSIYLTLEYSVDSMKTWKSIAGGYNFGGSYDWYPPNEASDKCFIRIYDTNDPTTYDINNVAFSIAKPNITLSTPNGGENWPACSQQRIEWTSEQVSNKVSISLSQDNGVTWSTIVSNYNNYTYNSYTWTVPNTVSGQNRIRVQDYSNNTLRDISETAFTISNNTSTLALTSPNGGEKLKGNAQTNITWTHTGTVSSVRLKYSTDNGVSWTRITDNAPNTGSYNWLIPNTGSSPNVLVHIADNGGCATDQSNSTFSIEALPIITLYAPYSGQTFGVGSFTYISWRSENLSNGMVNIDYTFDNGTTWKNIATGVFGAEYAWAIPNTLSSLCKVRISDANNPALQAMTNGTFTIAPAGITLLSPNGGEVLSGCASTYIHWSNTLTETVRLYFSADNGSSWTHITSLDAQKGSANYSYLWKVPAINAEKCLIKVTSYADTSIKDLSNGTFKITNNYTSTLKVTSPNGGENWASGSLENITWSADASVKFVNIRYSSDNGASWTTIARSVNNTGNYTWNVPTSVPVVKTLISVIDVDNSCNTDQSDASFNITGTPSISLVAPNGGEKLASGSTTLVLWNAAFLSGKVKLEYSLNNGSTWTLVADTLTNTGKYNWITPNANTNSCLLRVSDVANGLLSDVSNAVFTIDAPKLKISRPNGGEAWYGNTAKSVFWSASNIGASFVRLEYSLDSAKTWKLMADKEANDGAYTWNLPNSGSVNCFVKVSDYSNPAVFDMSDSVFTMIKPAFTILAPNGDETLKACTFATIVWTGNSSGNLFYSTDGGTSWTSMPGGYNYSSSWKVPEVSSSRCLIKIVDINDPSLFDISDAAFSITNVKPAITLTSPNGGEVWGTGQKKNITWTASEEVKFVKLEVAIGNNYNYSPLSFNEEVANDGVQEWTVYNNPGIAYIRISDKGSCASDVSNAAFTIQVAPFISIINPDDVHQWTAGTVQEIQWNAGNLTNGKVNLHYSVDGGKSWILIASNLESSSYYWKVPYTYTDNCVVKVTDAANTSVFATSKYIFKIVKPSFSYISISNGKELSSCMRTSLYWISKSGAVNLYYSADSGATWKTIAKEVQYPPYEWTVPQENSTKCFLKIVDVGDETAFGLADYMFSIDNPLRSVTLTNSFEKVATGSLKTITWTSTGSFYSALLEYSSDGGTTWNLIKEVHNLGSYKWRVPNEPSLNALFRISDKNSCATDQSEAFKIESVPYFIVTSPTVEDNWDAGSTHNIWWTKGNIADPAVNLHYSVDSGLTWTKIGATSQDYFAWTVPYVSSNKAFVKVSAAANSSIYGTNDEPFTISKPSITLLTPNGNERLTACTHNTITWKSSGVNSVLLYYSTDNGISWTRIDTRAYNGYASWLLPELSTNSALVKVVDASDPLVSDISDAVFEIQNKNTTSTLKLLSPNGGEVWNTYSEQEIKWTSTGTINNVTLMYSTLGGVDWQYITTVPNTGSYKWRVPNTSTLTGLFKVVDANSCISDVNDNQFDIKVVPYINIEYPQAGNNLSQSTSVYVSGAAANLSSDYVKLEYSVDGGKTWVFITENANRYYNSSFYYYWTVPAVVSNNCLLKASDALDPSTYYISNLFSISPATSVWPGDIDNNGTADVYDMLMVGLNFGNTGLPRTTISTAWAPQNALNWNKTQSNGLDMKFSDCDGDGIVYFTDTLAISKNYGLSHTTTSNLRTTAGDAELYFVLPQRPVPGNVLHAEIWTGSAEDQVNNLYGIAFNIAFNGKAIEPNSASLSFEENWLGDLGTQTLALHKEFESMGRIDGAVVRFDKTPRNGYGKIADLRLKLKEDVVAFNLGITAHKAVAADGAPIIFTPKNESIAMVTTSADELTSSLEAEVYPNPSTGEVFVRTPMAGKVLVTITNVLGEIAWTGSTNTGSLQMQLTDLPKGAYFIKVENESGSFVKKLILQ